MILKFRAYNEETESMFVVLGFDLVDNEIWSYDQSYELNKCNIMQSTGHMDINGVEIYDGDIVQSEHFFTYQVVFKGDCWRCEPIKKKYFKNRFIGNDLKIIGNIYQNKEILEVNNNE